MARYIEAKTIVDAEPMAITSEGTESQGYKVTHEDGRTIWVPKNEFEKDYIPIEDISDEYIDSLIVGSTIFPQDNRTLAMKVTLNNGESFTETYFWDDPSGYNIQEGESYCLGSIRTKIRESLKFTKA